MTTAGSLDFPTDPAALAGLPVSHLSQLTKSIPAPPGFDPGSWKSVAHLLPKADKVSLLHSVHYGIPGADLNALSKKGQALYAANQAKQQATKLAKAGGPTNCGASLGVQLAQAATSAPNLHAMKLADVGGFFAKHVAAPEDMDTHVLTQLRNSVKALVEEAADGGIDTPEVDALQQVWEWMKPLRSAVEDFQGGVFPGQSVLATQHAVDALQNVVYGLGGDAYADAKGMQQFAEVLLGKVKSDQGYASKQVLNQWGMVTQGNVYAFDSVSAVNAENLLEAYADLADQTATKLYQKMLPKDVNSLLANAEVLAEDVLTDPVMKAKLADLSIEQLDEFKTSVQKTAALAAEVMEDPKSAPWNIGLDAITEAQQTKELGNLLAADAATDAALQGAKDALSKLSAAELKKMAGEAAQGVGITPSLAKSYMDKDTLVSFIAKLDANPDPSAVVGEVADAQAKYAAHQAAQKAKKAGVKGPQAVPDAQAAPGTAQTTAKALDDAAEDAAAHAPLTIDSEELKDGLEQFAPSPELADIVTEVGTHKPAQVSHTWVPNPNEKALAGAHSKQTFLDEHGDVWMWKKAFEGTDDVEAAAHEVGWLLGFDMADIRVVENFPTRYGARESRFGTIQKFHKGVKGDLKGVSMGSLTPEQITQVQEHQVLDWLLSQHDTHAENLMVHADGHLIPIDKGQAWKFLGNDKLATDYNPVSKTVYSSLWDDVLRGRVEVDFDAIDGMLAKVEALDDDELRHLLFPVFKKRYDANPGSLHFLGGKAAKGPEEMFQVFLERKHNIRADFTAFYEDIAKRSGKSWTPRWAEAAQEAADLGLSPAQAAAAVNGVATPVDAALAAAVDASGSAGRSLHLAGEEISSGQALLWREKAVDGSKVLRMELRLEAEADQRITQLFADASGQAPTTSGYSAAAAKTAIPDPFYSDVLGGAKTINHHVGDQAYNANKITALQGAKAKAEGNLKLYAPTKVKQLLEQGFSEASEYAEAMAKYEQALHYLDLADDAVNAMAAAKKTTKLVEAFDGEAAYAKHLADAEKLVAPNAPKAVTVAPPPTFVGKPTLGWDEQILLDADPDEYMVYKRLGKTQALEGRAYTGVVDVDGAQVTVRYTGGTMTGQVPRKALLDVELTNWDGTEEAVQRVLRAVERLGVDMKLATEADEALTYWRVSTRAMKFSKEYASGQGAGAYGKVRATVDRIETRIAQTPGISPDDEVAIFKEEWASVFGQEQIDKAIPRLQHTHDLFGREVGYGHFERFDLPEDLGFVYQKGSKSYGIATGIQGHNFDPTALVDNPGQMSTQELVRRGQYNRRSNTSQSLDMDSGGAHGVFTSQGFSSWQSGGREVVVMNPSTVMRRTSSVLYPGDKFGRLSDRTTYNSLNPDTWQSSYLGTSMGVKNETLVRHMVSYADDMELTFVRSSAKRTEIIESLRKQGVTEIRGVPVADRIIYAPTDAEIIDRTTEFFGRNKHLYRDTLSERSAPGSVAAPRPTPAGPLPTSATATSPMGAPTTGLAADIDQVLTNILHGTVKNSVVAKAKAIAPALKKTPAAVVNEFKAYEAQYMHLTSDSQVKKFDTYLHHLKKKATIETELAKLGTQSEKALWVLDNAPHGVAKAEALGELFGMPYKDLQLLGKAEKGNQTMVAWLKTKAAELDASAGPPPGLKVTFDLYGGQIPKTVDAQNAVDLLTDAKNLHVKTAADAKVQEKLIAQALGNDMNDPDVVKSMMTGLAGDFGTTDPKYIASQLLKKVKQEAKNLGHELVPTPKGVSTFAGKLPGGATKVPDAAGVQELKDLLGGGGTKSEQIEAMLTQFGVDLGKYNGDEFAALDDLWIALNPTGQPGSTNKILNDLAVWAEDQLGPSAAVPAALPGAQEALAKAQSAVAKASNGDYADALNDMLESLGLPQGANSSESLTALQKAYDDLVQQGLVPPSDFNFGIEDFAKNIADHQQAKASITVTKAATGQGADLSQAVIFKAGSAEVKTSQYNDIYDAVQDYKNGATTSVETIFDAIDPNLADEAKQAMFKSWGAEVPGNPAYNNFGDWLLAKMDEGLDQASTPAPPTLPVGFKLNPKIGLQPNAVGSPVEFQPDVKVLGYGMPNGKVQVQYVKADDGTTNIIAQASTDEADELWYLIASQVKGGKTTKEQVVSYLAALNHPGVV